MIIMRLQTQKQDIYNLNYGYTNSDMADSVNKAVFGRTLTSLYPCWPMASLGEPKVGSVRSPPPVRFGWRVRDFLVDLLTGVR